MAAKPSTSRAKSPTSMKDPQLAELEAKLEGERVRRKVEDRLRYYSPYPKQTEFHAAGVTARERLLIAANQVGKTLAGGFEVAMHATGRYPANWKGKRFDEPIVGWVSGVTGEAARDNPQRILVGRPGQIGTGAIPKDSIADLVPSRGIPDLLDSIRVKHVSGGVSMLGVKSYEKGREKWQGETLDLVWFDEEPPIEVYLEGLTRTNATGGAVFVTFTPMLGMSETVRRFMFEPSPDRRMITMTIDDALHYTPEERERIAASYPEHEREARTKGVPVLGSGRIFPVPESLIACDSRDFPDHWPRIGGMDFGWDHPFAAVEIVWDRDQDVVYITKAHRLRETTPIDHAATLRHWGNLPWAWPRDGRRETLEGAGIALANQYGSQGLDMLHEHAQFEDGSVSVEAGLMDMLSRMEGGRFKVFRHLNDWFEEFRLYHRKDGKVFKENDDLMAATRYGLMMLRYARTIKETAPLRLTPPAFRRGGWMAA